MMRSFPYHCTRLVQFRQHGDLKLVFVIIQNRRQGSLADYHIFGRKRGQCKGAHICLTAPAGTHVMVFQNTFQILLEEKFFHNIEEMKISLFTVSELTAKVFYIVCR